jgi:plasmid maintenance system antidote protein VapI
MNQTQFAAAIHMKQVDLSKVERGKRAIGKKIAKRINKKFSIIANMLFHE